LNCTEVKAVINNFHALASKPGFHFVGNVKIGTDLSIEDLKSHYQLIVICYGAEDDRKLNIPGSHLKGIHSARSFVEWYNVLGDRNMQKNAPDFKLELDQVKDVVVIGNGNVAIDVARILLSSPDRLVHSDISSEAFNCLDTVSNSVRNVAVVGRRGPVQAAFTTKELRELLELNGVLVKVSDFIMTTESDEQELKESRARQRQLQLLETIYAKHGPSHVATVGNPKVLSLHFLRIPVAFEEDLSRPGHVGSVKFQVAVLEGPPGNQIAKTVPSFTYVPSLHRWSSCLLDINLGHSKDSLLTMLKDSFQTLMGGSSPESTPVDG
jgi:adrenodoxin-NADP+ reductase